MTKKQTGRKSEWACWTGRQTALLWLTQEFCAATACKLANALPASGFADEVDINCVPGFTCKTRREIEINLIPRVIHFAAHAEGALGKPLGWAIPIGLRVVKRK